MKKHIADMETSNPLETLHDNICRLNRLLVSFEHPWITHSGIIQKACAWYIAYAESSRSEACRLLDALNGFAVSTRQLTECGTLIKRMQAFFLAQEKELKRLFEYRQVIGQRHKKRQESLRAEGMGYCLSIGTREIYGVLYAQMQELYQVMERFLEREKAPFRSRRKERGEYQVGISKHVSLYADSDECQVNYSLDPVGADFDGMSAGQLRRIADAITSFLKIYGEHGEKKVRWDADDYSDATLPDVAFAIREDDRLPEDRSAPWVEKCIYQEEGEDVEIKYSLGVNDIHSSEFSFGEFVAIFRKLGKFLHHRL